MVGVVRFDKDNALVLHKFEIVEWLDLVKVNKSIHMVKAVA